jgi:hypothetical protein
MQRRLPAAAPPPSAAELERLHDAAIGTAIPRRNAQPPQDFSDLANSVEEGLRSAEEFGKQLKATMRAKEVEQPRAPGGAMEAFTGTAAGFRRSRRRRSAHGVLGSAHGVGGTGRPGWLDYFRGGGVPMAGRRPRSTARRQDAALAQTHLELAAATAAAAAAAR